MSNSISSSEASDFIDQKVLPYTDQNACIFDDDHIEVMQVSQAFPEETVFRRYNPALKADHSSSKWVCFPEYPFSLGLSFLFPTLISEFFRITRLCYPQLMPMGWRLLVTLHRLNHRFGLKIGVPEISSVYQLRTHGYSRFLLQRRTGAPLLVHGITMNEDEWRDKFFFVKRSSIPRGISLPVNWLLKGRNTGDKAGILATRPIILATKAENTGDKAERYWRLRPECWRLRPGYCRLGRNSEDPW
ncbi:hypothetical protein E3N88_45661 [Mikania micrantha]|uniref:Uncharacterized protein n=1 Tax=Mikania micrantha TaxID=192012 RepID=A0A5N6L8Q1_9ASTR|nr:hypothetical protein E3N88_45661 [Mikania micrantha]